MKLKEMIKVMQHYEDGGKVQYTSKNGGGNHWATVTSPTWDWARLSYRILEPKQKITIEKWLMQNTTDKIYSIIESSDVNKYTNYEKVKLITSYEVEL